jgi:hypothetical protein
MVNLLSCRNSNAVLKDCQAPAWHDGERIRYGIFVNDTMIGRIQRTLYFDINGNIPVYNQEIVTDMETEDGFLLDSLVVCFQRENYTPVWSWRKVESDLGYTIVSTRYQNSVAEIWRETIDGKETNRIKYKGFFLDNEMVMTYLRCLRFNLAKRYTLSLIAPMFNQKITGKIRYNGIATIRVPVGIFECDKITFESLNRKFYLYYERQEPRRLIQYQEKNTNAVVSLLSLEN